MALGLCGGGWGVVGLQGQGRDLPLDRGSLLKAQEVATARAEGGEVEGPSFDCIQGIGGQGDSPGAAINHVVLAIGGQPPDHSPIRLIGVVRQHEIRHHLARCQIGAPPLARHYAQLISQRRRHPGVKQRGGTGGSERDGVGIGGAGRRCQQSAAPQRRMAADRPQQPVTDGGQGIGGS